MSSLETLSATLPECCKDLRINLAAVLRGSSLSPARAWSVALASAYFSRVPALSDALLADGQGELSPADIDDARAAAALMGMTTVYYRFRHLVGKPVYSQLRANLRMNRMSSPATSKAQFELCALACAALAGCEVCLKSHEAGLVKDGVTEEQVHDAVRIASAVAGFAVALGVGTS
jgi:alkyl hydroperoxide reductase subunit D